MEVELRMCVFVWKEWEWRETCCIGAVLEARFKEELCIMILWLLCCTLVHKDSITTQISIHVPFKMLNTRIANRVLAKGH